MKDKNIEVLNKMYNYCNDIDNSLKRFGDNLESFINDKDYQNTVCMSLLQIGELTTHLSDEFKKIFSNEVDWRGAKGFRNIVAHRYGTVDHTTVWSMVKEEVPSISSFCKKQIDIHNLLMQESQIDPNSIENVIDITEEFEYNNLIGEYEQGLWKITSHTNDSQFELLYNNEPVIECFQNRLNEIENHKIDRALLNQAFDALYEKYDFLEQNQGQGNKY